MYTKWEGMICFFFQTFALLWSVPVYPIFLIVVQIQSTGIYKNRVLRVRFLHRLAGIPTSNPTLMTEMQLVNQHVMASCGFLRKGKQFHTYYSKHTYILPHDSWWYSTIFAVTQFVFRFFFTSHMKCQRTNCPYFHFELSSFFLSLELRPSINLMPQIFPRQCGSQMFLRHLLNRYGNFTNGCFQI